MHLAGGSFICFVALSCVCVAIWLTFGIAMGCGQGCIAQLLR